MRLSAKQQFRAYSKIFLVLFLATFPLLFGKFIRTQFLKYSISKTLQKLPKKDKALIEKFFYDAFILNGSAGYTLLGNKPMSWTYAYMGPPHGFRMLKTIQSSKNALMGQEAWAQHQHLFPSKRFLLMKRPHKWSTSFIFLNKEAAVDVIRKNPDVFEKYEDSAVSIQNALIQDLSQQDNPRVNLTQAQLGILYGFGRKNALAFDRSTEILTKAWSQNISLPSKDWRHVNAIRKEEVWWLPRMLRPEEKLSAPLQPSPGFTTLGKEYDILRGSEASRNKYAPRWDAELIFLPQFIITSGEELEGSETDKLMKGYRETRKKLMKLAKSKHFLRDVLIEWMR